MIIILSQKVDSKSTYEGDEVYKVYHYPRRYKNQIHTGDLFVYYQGNRYDKSQRYYFGAGKIGTIREENNDNYFAELTEVIRFKETVPIYLPDNGYIEQLGYETVRKSITPPWQSSIRPLAVEAFGYILKHSGIQEAIAEYDMKLKKAIQNYYIERNNESLIEIGELSSKLRDLHKMEDYLNDRCT